MSLPRMFAGCFSPEDLADDGHRLAPRFDALGDDSVPCRWWHPDMGPFCARCGSGRIDLHDGEWTTSSEPFSDDRPFLLAKSYGPAPWTTVQRAELGLRVEPEWWHQAAGIDTLGGGS